MKLFLVTFLACFHLSFCFVGLICGNNTIVQDCPCDECYQVVGGPFDSYIQCGTCSKDISSREIGLLITFGCNCDDGNCSYTVADVVNKVEYEGCVNDADPHWPTFGPLLNSFYNNMKKTNQTYNWCLYQASCVNWGKIGMIIGIVVGSLMLALIGVAVIVYMAQRNKKKKNSLLLTQQDALK